MSDELKPCPFCRGVDFRLTPTGLRMCCQCGCLGPWKEGDAPHDAGQLLNSILTAGGVTVTPLYDGKECTPADVMAWVFQNTDFYRAR